MLPWVPDNLEGVSTVTPEPSDLYYEVTTNLDRFIKQFHSYPDDRIGELHGEAVKALTCLHEYIPILEFLTCHYFGLSPTKTLLFCHSSMLQTISQENKEKFPVEILPYSVPEDKVFK